MWIEGGFEKRVQRWQGPAHFRNLRRAPSTTPSLQDGAVRGARFFRGALLQMNARRMPRKHALLSRMRPGKHPAQAASGLCYHGAWRTIPGGGA
jgi:hypothetical protein